MRNRLAIAAAGLALTFVCTGARADWRTFGDPADLATSLVPMRPDVRLEKAGQADHGEQP